MPAAAVDGGAVMSASATASPGVQAVGVSLILLSSQAKSQQSTKDVIPISLEAGNAQIASSVVLINVPSTPGSSIPVVQATAAPAVAGQATSASSKLTLAVGQEFTTFAVTPVAGPESSAVSKQSSILGTQSSPVPKLIVPVSAESAPSAAGSTVQSSLGSAPTIGQSTSADSRLTSGASLAGSISKTSAISGLAALSGNSNSVPLSITGATIIFPVPSAASSPIVDAKAAASSLQQAISNAATQKTAASSAVPRLESAASNVAHNVNSGLPTQSRVTVPKMEGFQPSAAISTLASVASDLAQAASNLPNPSTHISVPSPSNAASSVGNVAPTPNTASIIQQGTGVATAASSLASSAQTLKGGSA